MTGNQRILWICLMIANVLFEPASIRKFEPPWSTTTMGAETPTVNHHKSMAITRVNRYMPSLAFFEQAWQAMGLLERSVRMLNFRCRREMLKTLRVTGNPGGYGIASLLKHKANARGAVDTITPRGEGRSELGFRFPFPGILSIHL